MTSIAEHALGAVRRTLPAVLDPDLLRRCYPLRYFGLMAVCFVLMRPIMVGQTPALAPMMKVLTAVVFAWLLLGQAPGPRRARSFAPLRRNPGPLPRTPQR